MNSFTGKQEFLDRITEIIVANLTNDQFGVAGLAREMGTSRSSLHRKVKRVANLSVSQFICQLRLKIALDLLKKNTLTISEIAFECGFHSVSYFIRCFHNFYGLSPGEFNKKEIRKITERTKKNVLSEKFQLIRNLPGVTIGIIAILVISFTYILNTQIPGPSTEIPVEKSLGVYPFTYISDDPEKKYLADGMMEAILLHLSRIEDLRVLSRNSLENYRGINKSPITIGQELGIDYLVEGSFHKDGDKMNLIVRLIRTSDAVLCWSNEYSHEWKDVFRVQSMVATKIADELNAAITPEEIQLIKKIPTFSITAYDFYQRGREEYMKFQMNNMNREALEKAEDYYRVALKYDNRYAQAYSGLAEVYKSKNRGSEYFSESFLDSVLVLADIALSFDDKSAEAYTVKGLYYWYKGNREKALEEYNNALAENPNFWEAYRGKATLFMDTDPVRCIENYQKAASLVRGSDLQMILWEMINAYLWAGFTDIALKYNQEAVRLFGDSIVYYLGLGAIESQKGNTGKAIEHYHKVYEKDSTYFSAIWFYYDITRQLGLNNTLAGHHEESLKYFRKWISILEEKGELSYNGMHRVGYSLWKNGYTEDAEYYMDLQMEHCENIINTNHIWAQNFFAYYDRAAIYSFRGNKEKAYEDLRVFNQIKRPPLWMVTLIKQDPLFDSLRKEPEFQQIIKDIETKYLAEHERVGKFLAEHQ